MKYIDFETIKRLGITPSKCIEWVKTALLKKYDCVLPPKISIHIPEDKFINTMPSYISDEHRFGVKIVSRYPERIPSLQSDLLLYDTDSGNLLALMDGTWITTMRTGATAALSIKYLQKSTAKKYGFIGLGNTARATLLCFLSIIKDTPIEVILLRYKDQADSFINRFKDYNNLTFRVYDEPEKLIKESDVVISCVTVAHENFAPDYCFNPGVLVVPVHTRGFQNCDLCFDKIFADDMGHVCKFEYFNKFKKFDEFSRVLLGMNKGRENDEERIMIYNIGIALNDLFFASRIYQMTLQKNEFTQNHVVELNKFWV